MKLRQWRRTCSGSKRSSRESKVANSKNATLRLLALTIFVLAVVSTACSGDGGAVAEAVDSSSSSDVVVSDSAQQAVTELLGDIDASGPVATVVVEQVEGVAYDLSETGVLESSVDSERNLLQVKIQGAEGRRISMKNGGAIRLREGLLAEIFVDPYPTHTLTAWIDLFLRDEASEPNTDLKVVIDYDMYSMGHGPFFTTADKSPNGHYTFRLDYVMFGPWMQLLSITDPETDEEYVLEVVIVAVP